MRATKFYENFAVSWTRSNSLLEVTMRMRRLGYDLKPSETLSVAQFLRRMGVKLRTLEPVEA